MSDSPDTNNILYFSFNQDSSCFAIGTEKGFGIFNTYPFLKTVERNMNGGIGIIEMLGQSNLLALVGGGSNPKYPPNKVIIWDDNEAKEISELAFHSEIKGIKLKIDKIFVVLQNAIYYFEIKKFKLIQKLETFDNPKGILTISSNTYINVVAYPDSKIGHVLIRSFDKETLGTSLVKVHDSRIACLQINNVASLLATASEVGTVIRIVNLADSTIALELRRGTDKAEIFSLQFDFFSKFLTSTSDRGTVHIFSLDSVNKEQKEGENNVTEGKNQKSALSKITRFLGLSGTYFDSEWSFAQLRIGDIKSICTFGGNKNNRIIVVSTDFKYYNAVFDTEKGGDCEQQQLLDIELDFEEKKEEDKKNNP